KKAAAPSPHSTFNIKHSTFPVPPRNYAELHTASSFSFLAGASLPEDLMHTAAEVGIPAMALIDRNGVYGAPRFYGAAKKTGVKALLGAALTLDPNSTEDAGHGT